MALLEIEDLSVQFPSHKGTLHAVEGVNLRLDAGEVLGIVGESGSGKSVSMMALMGLLAFPAQVQAKTLRFDGHDMLGTPERQRRQLTGKSLSMIFQDPTTSLNPCFTVGYQLSETLKLHLGLTGKALRMRCIELLEQVGIPVPESRLSLYPHQLSGGMSQRVMIAMAIACKPKLLIADEPTTALDVTIQAQILDLLRQLQKEYGMALILITHNMGVVNEMAQRVAVMYAGQLMEQSDAQDLFTHPHHPYTQALLASLPEHNVDAQQLATIPGVVPGLHDRPSGCLFAPRCQYTQTLCATRPPIVEQAIEHTGQGKSTLVRCHFPLHTQTHLEVQA